jgi:ppGpp synthetase/RelA/SpoT-type nucleotidyltranferase
MKFSAFSDIQRLRGRVKKTHTIKTKQSKKIAKVLKEELKADVLQQMTASN